METDRQTISDDQEEEIITYSTCRFLTTEGSGTVPQTFSRGIFDSSLPCTGITEVEIPKSMVMLSGKLLCACEHQRSAGLCPRGLTLTVNKNLYPYILTKEHSSK